MHVIPLFSFSLAADVERRPFLLPLVVYLKHVSFTDLQ